MMFNTLFLVSLLVASLLTGKYSLKLLTGSDLDITSLFSMALPLGLGTGGLFLGICGNYGSLSSGIIVWIVVTIILLGIELNGVKRSHLNSIKNEIKDMSLPLVLFYLMLFTVWLGLYAPVIDGDALCYHLEVAKRIGSNSGLSFDPDLHETVYPLNVESLQAMALAFQGPIASRMISFLFGLSLACSAALLAQPLLGKRNSILAGCLVLSLPIINCGMISPLNDVPLAALSVSALAAMVYLKKKQVSFLRELIVSGLFCGLACGVKFPGIIWSLVMSGFVFLRHEDNELQLRERIIGKIKYASLFWMVVCISGGYWYGRAAVLTGNPVHPYFRNTFGGHGLDEVLAEDFKTPVHKMTNIISAPLVMSLVPSSFDSFSQQIGPVLLAIIPLGFLFKMPRLWYAYLAIGWVEMAICLTQRQSPRFYIASFVPWSVAGMSVISKYYSFSSQQNNHKSQHVISGLLIFLVSITIAFNLARVKTSALVLTGFLEPNHWLVKHEPTAYISRWVAANLPEQARIIGQDHRSYYWPRSYTMEKAHRRRLGFNETTIGSDAMIRHFRLEGFTHLVMAEPIPMNAVEFDPALSLILRDWLEIHQPLLDLVLPENDGYSRRYRIYDISQNAQEMKYAPMDNAVRRAAIVKDVIQHGFSESIE